MYFGLPWWLRGNESTCKAGDMGSIPRLGRSPGEGKGYPFVFWPGEFHGLYSPWGCKEWGMTKRASLNHPSNTLRIGTNQSCFGLNHTKQHPTTLDYKISNFICLNLNVSHISRRKKGHVAREFLRQCSHIT